MKAARRYAIAEMGDIEDAVCQAVNAAAVAKLVLETALYRGPKDHPLTREERELLWFAVAEVVEHTEIAKDAFYKLAD